jgi:hypothetical protein
MTLDYIIGRDFHSCNGETSYYKSDIPFNSYPTFWGCIPGCAIPNCRVLLVNALITVNRHIYLIPTGEQSLKGFDVCGCTYCVSGTCIDAFMAQCIEAIVIC